MKKVTESQKKNKTTSLHLSYNTDKELLELIRAYCKINDVTPSHAIRHGAKIGLRKLLNKPLFNLLK
jgi:hypothetical protein